MRQSVDIELTKTRSKTEEFILKFEAFSFLVIDQKIKANANFKFLFYRPNDEEFKIFVDNQAISYRINQNEERSKIEEFILKCNCPVS